MEIRSRRLVRCLRLIEKLRSGYFDIHQLAAEFGVHHRTIRRDLDAIQEAHLSIVSTEYSEALPRWHIPR